MHSQFRGTCRRQVAGVQFFMGPRIKVLGRQLRCATMRGFQLRESAQRGVIIVHYQFRGACRRLVAGVQFFMGPLIMGSDPRDVAVGLGEHMPAKSRTPPG